MRFEVKPLQGIYWNNGKVELGYTKDQVKDMLGEPDVYDNIYYYFNSELSFHFDDNDKVEFIEFLAGTDGNLQPILYDRVAFNTYADQLYSLLFLENSGEVDDSENGYSIIFKNISVGLYRESTSRDVNDMIEEMVSEGIDIEGNEDIQTEKKKSQYWSTLGIGCLGYYS